MDIDDDSGNTSRSATGGELNRAELAARKEEAIEDKVRSALEFKKEVDQKKEREQAEFDSAKAKHEQALNVISMVLNLSKEFLHYLSLLSLSVFIVDVGNEQQGEKKCAHSAVDHACKLVATT
jgi:restriction endonuclease Mrr